MCVYECILLCVCVINDQARAGNAGRAQPDERKKGREREGRIEVHRERERKEGKGSQGYSPNNKNIINYHIKYTANPLYRPAFPC